MRPQISHLDSSQGDIEARTETYREIRRRRTGDSNAVMGQELPEQRALPGDVAVLRKLCKRPEKGFHTIELIVIVFVLALLGIIGFNTYQSAKNEANKKTEADLTVPPEGTTANIDYIFSQESKDSARISSHYTKLDQDRARQLNNAIADVGNSVKESSLGTSSQFCANTSATFGDINDKITAATDKIAAAGDKNIQDAAQNLTQWSQDFKQSRAFWDQKRQASLTKLEARAQNSTQLAAIKAYEGAIIDAPLALRDQRVVDDEFLPRYSADVANAIKDLQLAKANKQIADFNQAVKAAESAAQDSCKSAPGTDAPIQATLQASISQARQAFSLARSADETIGKLQTIATSRDFNYGLSQLKKVTKTARENLRKALNNQSA